MGNRVVCTIRPTGNGHPSPCPLSLLSSQMGEGWPRRLEPQQPQQQQQPQQLTALEPLKSDSTRKCV